jgi:hypothetical protein
MSLLFVALLLNAAVVILIGLYYVIWKPNVYKKPEGTK